MASSLVSNDHVTWYSVQGLWLVVMVAAIAEAEFCGDPPLCQCTAPIRHALRCFDRNTTHFPSFEPYETAGISEVIIRDTEITKLPFFGREDWPTLKLLDVRNNSRLPCEHIARLRRRGLLLIADCFPLAPDRPIAGECVSAPPSERHPSLLLAVALPTLLVLTSTVSLLIYRGKRLGGRYHVTVPPETPPQQSI